MSKETNKDKLYIGVEGIKINGKTLDEYMNQPYKKSLTLLDWEVKGWFFDKGIENFRPTAQLKKIAEEVGEVEHAFESETEHEMMVEIGDVMVTLIGFCAMNDIDLRDCLELAHKKIMARTGEFIDGSFVKTEDLWKYKEVGVMK